MKLPELEQKLIAAARAHPPGDQVPYAFAKRVSALLASRPVLDRWALWSQALWRGAAGCLLVVVLLGLASVFVSSNSGSANDLSQDFENTMLASAPQDADLLW
ncbi:MAG: hypothetical protein U1F65_10305 [Verrucomicrobiota bacterium]